VTNRYASSRSFPRASHILWILLTVVLLRVGFYLLSDGFSISKIKNTFPVTSEWQLPPPTSDEQKQLKSICEKPFYYFGKGSQVYAFLSEDQKYVLKLFKCYHLQPAHWIALIPLPSALDTARNNSLTKRQKKIADTLQSYKIASQSLRDECGLVAMEILPTPKLHQEITLVDKLGRSHKINLGDYGFIMQRRADLIFPKLASWIANGDIASCKKAISSMVALIVQRSRKGVQDSDPDLHKNAGLIDTTAILIDLGSLHPNLNAANADVFTHDLKKITNRLNDWLKKQSPELSAYLQEEIQQAAKSRWKKPTYPDERSFFNW